MTSQKTISQRISSKTTTLKNEAIPEERDESNLLERSSTKSLKTVNEDKNNEDEEKDKLIEVDAEEDENVKADFGTYKLLLKKTGGIPFWALIMALGFGQVYIWDKESVVWTEFGQLTVDEQKLEYL